MATKIVTKNSSTASAVPTASDLVQGELAVNVADKRLFTEDNGGSIIELGTNPSTIDINAGSIDGTAIGASSASTGAFTTLTATGSVGIGTSSFDATNKLEVTGDINTTWTSGASRFIGMRFGNGSLYEMGLVCKESPELQVYAKHASGAPITFLTGATPSERMRIDSSGNVGIGTTSPNEKLTIAGDVQIGESSGGEKLKFVGASSKYNFLVGKQVNVDNALEITPSTAAGGNTFSTPAVVVNSSGNVGIGTSSPAADLHVDASAPEFRLSQSGTAKVRLRTNGDNYINTGQNLGIGTSSPTFSSGSFGGLHVHGSSGTSLRMTNAASGQTASDGYEILLDPTSKDTLYVNRESANQRFYTGGSERMRIDSSGNLLVGTTSTANIGTHTPNVVTDLQYGINNGSNIATFGLDRIHFNSSNYYVLNASSTGVKLVNGATSWTTQSDVNLKENIIELTSVLEKVKNFRCVNYNLKTQNADYIKTGFIAQDWQENFSSVVHEDEDGTLGMNYTETIPVLLKAIQEQQTLIESLTARIAALEE